MRLIGLDMRTNWGSHCPFNTPTELKPVVESANWNSEKVTPPVLMKCLPLPGNEFVVREVLAAIVLLNLARCPTTVTRFVIPVIINAVNRVFRSWAPSHIFKEIEEGFIPPITESDTASAIVFEPRILRIGTPLAHSLPGVVLRLSTSAVGVKITSHLNFLSDAMPRLFQQRGAFVCSGL